MLCYKKLIRGNPIIYQLNFLFNSCIYRLCIYIDRVRLKEEGHIYWKIMDKKHK